MPPESREGSGGGASFVAPDAGAAAPVPKAGRDEPGLPSPGPKPVAINVTLTCTQSQDVRILYDLEIV